MPALPTSARPKRKDHVMMPTATCQYCGWNGPADQCGPLKNAWERLQPGDTVPAGECPKCNASAMLDEMRQEPSATIVTTLVPERATKFGVRSTAEALADVMWLAANRYSYRVEDLGSSGFRVAVYLETPKRDTGPRGYLRIEDGVSTAAPLGVWSLRRKCQRVSCAGVPGVNWRERPRGFESRPPHRFPPHCEEQHHDQGTNRHLSGLRVEGGRRALRADRAPLSAGARRRGRRHARGRMP